MAYEVRRSVACRLDLEYLLDHLFESYRSLGEDSHAAFERAALRIESIETAMDALGDAPYQGTLWPEVMHGLRWVTKDRAVFYFMVDDDARVVRILAVFFGGQDHRAHLLERIRRKP